MNKQEVWQRETAKTKRITDKLGMGVDPKVVDVVTAMRLHSFRTTTSCEGHIDRTTSGPFVKFESSKAAVCFQKAEVSREELIAQGKYKEELNEGRIHTWREMQRMNDLITVFQKDTQWGSELLIVRYVMNKHIFLQFYGAEFMNLYDRGKKQKILARRQGIMNEFARYLKELYFS